MTLLNIWFSSNNLINPKGHNKITMNKWLELLLGLILIVGTVYAWGMDLYGFGTAALEFLKGGLVWFVIMIGLMFLLLGISDLKE